MKKKGHHAVPLILWCIFIMSEYKKDKKKILREENKYIKSEM